MAKFEDVKKNWDYWYFKLGIRHILTEDEYEEAMALLVACGKEVVRENNLDLEEAIGNIPLDIELGEKSQAIFDKLLEFFVNISTKRMYNRYVSL